MNDDPYLQILHEIAVIRQALHDLTGHVHMMRENYIRASLDNSSLTKYNENLEIDRLLKQQRNSSA